MVSNVLLRRVNRVRARVERFDSSDAILDDVTVLWRAFESTFEDLGRSGQQERAQAAVASVVEYAGLHRLPAIGKFVARLGEFHAVDDQVIEDWFVDPQNPVKAATVRTWLQGLYDTSSPAARWRDHHSKLLGKVLYSIRSAVIHARLETTDRLVSRVLPQLREAMIELIIARAAEMAGIPPAAARLEFDNELPSAAPAHCQDRQ